MSYFFFSSRRRHTVCALVTGVQTCALPIYDTGRADRVVNKVIELFRREAVQLGHLPPFFDGSAGCLIVSGCRCPSVRGDARETVELLDGRNRPRDRTMPATVLGSYPTNPRSAAT